MSQAQTKNKKLHILFFIKSIRESMKHRFIEYFLCFCENIRRNQALLFTFDNPLAFWMFTSHTNKRISIDSFFFKQFSHYFLLLFLFFYLYHIWFFISLCNKVAPFEWLRNGQISLHVLNCMNESFRFDCMKERMKKKWYYTLDENSIYAIDFNWKSYHS